MELWDLVSAFGRLMREAEALQPTPIIVDDTPQHVYAAQVIMQEAERMANLVRRIGKITRYETKSYVGDQRILDLDRATDDGPENR